MKPVIAICAATLAFIIVLQPLPGAAHGGEDHSSDKTPAAAKLNSVPPPAGGEAPSRLSDGSVFMPKASQHLLGIRTALASVGNVHPVLRLKGYVKADPSAGGQVQATQAGRIVGGAHGLPVLGQKVKAGQVLARLEPVLGNVEKSNQQAQLVQIRSQLSLAERKVARYEQLEGIIPQKEIEIAQAELRALKQQQAAIGGGLNARLPLIAPVSGVISKVAVTAGQVVDARQTIFEMVNPQRLIVDALGYDARLTGDIASVSGSTDNGGRLNLALQGTGMELREQALPIQLRILPPVPSVAVGQPVNVFVQLKDSRRGVMVPEVAVTSNAAGERMVWVHTAAERFAPRKIKGQNVDADTVVVTQGLAGGERVVVEGVTAFTQVR